MKCFKNILNDIAQTSKKLVLYLSSVICVPHLKTQKFCKLFISKDRKTQVLLAVFEKDSIPTKPKYFLILSKR